MTAEKPRRGTVKSPPSETVVVASNYQVSHDGKVYAPGDKVQVPADVAAKWRAIGYVT